MNAVNIKVFTSALCLAASLVVTTSASAQDTKHYRFAHDQQLNSGYSVAYDIFSAKLKALSGSSRDESTIWFGRSASSAWCRGQARELSPTSRTHGRGFTLSSWVLPGLTMRSSKPTRKVS